MRFVNGDTGCHQGLIKPNKILPRNREDSCIKKTTRLTSGSKKPMAISKQPCYNIGAVCQLHE